jgi:hypothetical protein
MNVVITPPQRSQVIDCPETVIASNCAIVVLYRLLAIGFVTHDLTIPVVRISSQPITAWIVSPARATKT